MGRCPELFECSPGAEEPGAACPPPNCAHPELGQQCSRACKARCDHEDRNGRETPHDFVPLQLGELRVDAVEEMYVCNHGPVAAQIVLEHVRFRENFGQASDCRVAVVGEQQPSVGSETMEPPLERSAAHAVGGKRAGAGLGEPGVDCLSTGSDVVMAFCLCHEGFACRGDRESAPRLRSESIPHLGTREILANDFPVDAEVVVVPDREPQPAQENSPRGSSWRSVDGPICLRFASLSAPDDGRSDALRSITR